MIRICSHTFLDELECGKGKKESPKTRISGHVWPASQRHSSALRQTHGVPCQCPVLLENQTIATFPMPWRCSKISSALNTCHFENMIEEMRVAGKPIAVVSECRFEGLRDHTALKLTKSLRTCNKQNMFHLPLYVVCHLDWSSQQTSDKWSLTNNLPNRQLLPEYLEEFLQSVQILEEGNEKTCGKIAETICKSKRYRMVTLYQKKLFWMV